MKHVSLSELHEHLDEYIEAAREGETVEVRDGGRAIAQLCPPPATPDTEDTRAPNEISDEEWRTFPIEERLRRSGIRTTGRQDPAGLRALTERIPPLARPLTVDSTTLLREDRDAR